MLEIEKEANVLNQTEELVVIKKIIIKTVTKKVPNELKKLVHIRVVLYLFPSS